MHRSCPLVPANGISRSTGQLKITNLFSKLRGKICFKYSRFEEKDSNIQIIFELKNRRIWIRIFQIREKDSNLNPNNSFISVRYIIREPVKKKCWKFNKVSSFHNIQSEPLLGHSLYWKNLLRLAHFIIYQANWHTFPNYFHTIENTLFSVLGTSALGRWESYWQLLLWTPHQCSLTLLGRSQEPAWTAVRKMLREGSIAAVYELDHCDHRARLHLLSHGHQEVRIRDWCECPRHGHSNEQTPE